MPTIGQPTRKLGVIIQFGATLASFSDDLHELSITALFTAISATKNLKTAKPYRQQTTATLKMLEMLTYARMSWQAVQEAPTRAFPLLE